MFQDFADIYEALIDWPKRLAREGPFYRRWFERHGVRAVVDTACGVGRHAAMFHAWNLRVEGADLSSAMIERARERFGEPPGLRWIVRGFDEPIAALEPFDAAVCVGNSLALASDRAVVERAVRAMLAAVRPGGLVILHGLNLWRLPDGPVVWQKCRRIAQPPGEVLVVKGVRRCGSRGFVELAVADLAEGQRLASPDVPIRSESSPLLALEAAEIQDLARAGGGAKIELFGGYDGQPYERDRSEDLIAVVEKSM